MKKITMISIPVILLLLFTVGGIFGNMVEGQPWSNETPLVLRPDYQIYQEIDCT